MLDYTTNGYRLWHLEKHRVIAGRNVTFNEMDFKIRVGSSNQETRVGSSSQEVDVGSPSQYIRAGNSNQMTGVGSSSGSEERRIVAHSDPNTREGCSFWKDPSETTHIFDFEAAEQVSDEHRNCSGENGQLEIIERDELVSRPLRRSCRARLLPKHFKDYSLLAQVARLTDKIDESSLLNDNPTKLNLWDSDQRGIFQQFSDEGKIVLNAVNFCNEVPLSFEDLNSSPDKEQWMEAVKDELQALDEKNTCVRNSKGIRFKGQRLTAAS